MRFFRRKYLSSFVDSFTLFNYSSQKVAFMRDAIFLKRKYFKQFASAFGRIHMFILSGKNRVATVLGQFFCDNKSKFRRV